tara:strand:- start:87927 stop:88103 length:177 start_codon:yes stop_codon:yes gene_type:complete
MSTPLPSGFSRRARPFITMMSMGKSRGRLTGVAALAKIPITAGRINGGAVAANPLQKS